MVFAVQLNIPFDRGFFNLVVQGQWQLLYIPQPFLDMLAVSHCILCSFNVLCPCHLIAASLASGC